MVLMRVFCSRCSVRLATVFAAVLGELSSILFGIMILVMGPEQLASRVEWLHRFNEDHVKNAVLHWIFAGLSGHLRELYWMIAWSNVIHLCSSVLALVGCLKLSRPLVGQFIPVHAFKLLFLSAYIVTNLVLLKKQINLGLLILVILLEGLLLALFWYNLAAVIALFQIIKVVKSGPYEMRFGTRGSGSGASSSLQHLLLMSGSKVVVDPNANAHDAAAASAGNAKPFGN